MDLHVVQYDHPGPRSRPRGTRKERSRGIPGTEDKEKKKHKEPKEHKEKEESDDADLRRQKESTSPKCSKKDKGARRRSRSPDQRRTDLERASARLKIKRGQSPEESSDTDFKDFKDFKVYQRTKKELQKREEEEKRQKELDCPGQQKKETIKVENSDNRKIKVPDQRYKDTKKDAEVLDGEADWSPTENDPSEASSRRRLTRSTRRRRIESPDRRGVP